MLCLFIFLTASNQHLKEQQKVFVYSVANPNVAKLLRKVMTLSRSTIKVTITNNPRLLTLASSEVSPFRITILCWAIWVLSRFLDLLEHEIMYASSRNERFFTKWFHCWTYQSLSTELIKFGQIFRRSSIVRFKIFI